MVEAKYLFDKVRARGKNINLKVKILYGTQNKKGELKELQMF